MLSKAPNKKKQVCESLTVFICSIKALTDSPDFCKVLYSQTLWHFSTYISQGHREEYLSYYILWALLWSAWWRILECCHVNHWQSNDSLSLILFAITLNIFKYSLIIWQCGYMNGLKFVSKIITMHTFHSTWQHSTSWVAASVFSLT